MPILLLSRPKPLTPAEVRALPRGCVPVDEGGVVARAEVDLPIVGLLGYAVALGRAVPDALFSVLEEGVGERGSATVAAAAAASPERASMTTGRVAPSAPTAGATTDEVITETDPWKLVDARRIADAERVFAAGNGLDSPGRERCRALLAARDPAEVALGCRIARLTSWRSIVVNLRLLLRHDHPAVRRDAVEAVGALAGPSLAAAVKPLLDDPDAEVRAAATAAHARLA